MKYNFLYYIYIYVFPKAKTVQDICLVPSLQNEVGPRGSALAAALGRCCPSAPGRCPAPSADRSPSIVGMVSNGYPLVI